MNDNTQQPFPIPKTFLQRFAKQIAFGVLCTCISTLIVNVAGIKKWVLYVCDGIGIVGGKPLSGEKGLIPKIQGNSQDQSHSASDAPAVAPQDAGSTGGGARIKEEKEKGQNESRRKTVIAELESMGVEFDREATLEKLLVVLKEEKAKRDNESNRQIAIAELESLGVEFDREATLEKLQVELKDAKEMQRKHPSSNTPIGWGCMSIPRSRMTF